MRHGVGGGIRTLEDYGSDGKMWLPHCMLWLRAGAHMTITGVSDNVVRWPDWSGNHNHAMLNAVIANPPEYKPAGGVNGRDGVYFNRGGWMGLDVSTIDHTDGAQAGSWTVFAAYTQYNAHNDIQGLLGTDSLPGGNWFNPCMTVNQTSKELGCIDNTGFLSPGAAAVAVNGDQYCTWSMQEDGDLEVYRNGVLLASTAYDSTDRAFCNLTVLGSQNESNDYAVDMVLSELILFAGAMAPAPMAEVHAMMAALY